MVWRTIIITFTTCFLLGTTFTHWIADHNVLWRSPLTADALLQSMTYYSLFGSGPPGLGWVYIAVGTLGVLAVGGRLVSGWRGTDGRSGEVLFDGGSVVLLAGITYNQAVEVFPTISMIPSPLPADVVSHPLYPGLSTAVRDLANDNVITAVMLTGVLLLQAGRYYSAKTSPTSLPPSANSSYRSSPVEADAESESSSIEPRPRSSSFIKRAGTPYRELTEDEAFELAEMSKTEVDEELTLPEAVTAAPKSGKSKKR